MPELMSETSPEKQTPKKEQVAAAWAVHAFTASGIVLGFLAVVAILEGDRIAAFLWLGWRCSSMALTARWRAGRA
jgi:phosphatidylcholine synthase